MVLIMVRKVEFLGICVGVWRRKQQSLATEFWWWEMVIVFLKNFSCLRVTIEIFQLQQMSAMKPRVIQLLLLWNAGHMSRGNCPRSMRISEYYTHTNWLKRGNILDTGQKESYFPTFFDSTFLQIWGPPSCPKKRNPRKFVCVWILAAASMIETKDMMWKKVFQFFRGWSAACSSRVTRHT